LVLELLLIMQLEEVNRMNKFIKLPLYLAIVGALTTAALATVHQFTAPIIAENIIKAEEAALQELFEGAISVVLDEEPEHKFDKNEEKSGLVSLFIVSQDDTILGYVYKSSVVGYNGGVITFLISISPDGVYNGYKVVTMQDQTSGIGTKVADADFYEQFLDKEITSVSEIVKLDGATITTQPVVDAIKAATQHFSAHIKQ
jgi:electron transport complex protein RnfG